MPASGSVSGFAAAEPLSNLPQTGLRPFLSTWDLCSATLDLRISPRVTRAFAHLPHQEATPPSMSLGVTPKSWGDLAWNLSFSIDWLCEGGTWHLYPSGLPSA